MFKLKSAESGRVANGVLSLFGAGCAFYALIMPMRPGAPSPDASAIFLGGCFVFGATIVRGILMSMPPSGLRRGSSWIAFAITALGAVVCGLFGVSGWTIAATLLLAAGPLVQDFLTPLPDWFTSKVVPLPDDEEDQHQEVDQESEARRGA